MNRMRIVAGVLVLMLGTGCPVGGEAGVLHQAMLKDMMDEMAHDSCLEDDVRAVCGPQFKECMAECRKAMEKRGWK
ncbi:hypothetical protein [Archangium sp.]|uniref:hypothetical protein n=1 Tax=Archangium sp. TaxID=1872627 RepID=UPI00286A8DEB|nr:hypothetical protein [Archangium sp.]